MVWKEWSSLSWAVPGEQSVHPALQKQVPETDINALPFIFLDSTIIIAFSTSSMPSLLVNTNFTLADLDSQTGPDILCLGHTAWLSKFTHYKIFHKEESPTSLSDLLNMFYHANTHKKWHGKCLQQIAHWKHQNWCSCQRSTKFSPISWVQEVSGTYLAAMLQLLMLWLHVVSGCCSRALPFLLFNSYPHLAHVCSDWL